MHDQVIAFLLDESCDHIFDMEEECLNFSLRKHEENGGIFEVQHF